MLHLAMPCIASASTLLLSKTRIDDGEGYSQQNWSGLTNRLNADVTSPITLVNDLSNLNQLLSYDGLWIDQREIGTGALTALETANLQTYIATGRRVVVIGGNSAWSSWNNSVLSAVGGSYSGAVYSGGNTPVNSFVPITTGFSSITTPTAGIATGGNASLFQDRFATTWGPANNVLVLLSEAVVDEDRLKLAANSVFATNLANWITGHLPTPNMLWKSPLSGNWNDGTKWLPGAMPSNVDDAAFNLGSSYTVSITNPVTAGNLSVSSDQLTLSFTGTANLSVTNTINIGPSSSLTLHNAIVSTKQITGNGSLAIDAGSHLSVQPHSGGTASANVIGNLSVAGILDLTNNDLIVHNGNITAITAILNNARIISSQSSSLMTLAMMQNVKNNQPIYSTFDGENVSSTDVLIKFTYFGDTDLNGRIDGTDYTQIDNAFAAHGALTGWANGDLNYDGKIDGSDYTLIDNAFNRQAPTTSAIPAFATSQVAVPEPTIPTALILIAFATARLKRKHPTAFIGHGFIGH